MADAKRTHYVSVVMNDDELKMLDDWAWLRRVRSRSDAIRMLVAFGMAAQAERRAKIEGHKARMIETERQVAELELPDVPAEEPAPKPKRPKPAK